MAKLPLNTIIYISFIESFFLSLLFLFRLLLVVLVSYYRRSNTRLI